MRKLSDCLRPETKLSMEQAEFTLKFIEKLENIIACDTKMREIPINKMRYMYYVLILK